MDIALKQRLVGASVLIALAVVVLPMLLGGRPDSDVPETQKIELPSHPAELDFETRRYPIGEIPPSRSPKNEPSPAKALPTPGPASGVITRGEQDETPGDTPDETVQAESPDEPQVTPGQDPEEIAVNPAPEEAPSKVVIAPLAAPAEKTEEAGRYVVQVASFGALDNANRLAGTLRGYGYSVLLDSVKSDVGTLHRVRVGPYATEAEANGTIGRLQAQVKNIKPRVMDLQPEKAAQVAQPSDPLVRWVVQVGSFSSAKSAEDMVANLRLAGFSAFSETVSSATDTVYKVRIGPELDRDKAAELALKVKKEQGLDAFVTTQE